MLGDVDLAKRDRVQDVGLTATVLADEPVPGADVKLQRGVVGSDAPAVTENFSIFVLADVGVDASTPVTALCLASIS